MKIDSYGYPVWIAPSGKEYVLPKEYFNFSADMICILQNLLKDKLYIEYEMIKEELGLK